MYNYSKWQACRRCPLCETRYKVVHYRGMMPADILVLGEAPGRTENTTGQPFTGPAGYYCLNRILELVKTGLPEGPPSFCISNMVCCAPLDEDNNFRAPNYAEIDACSERLLELIKTVVPKLVVLAGQVALEHYQRLDKGIEIKKLKLPATQATPWHLGIPVCHILHPSAMIQGPLENFAPRVHTAAAEIMNAWDLLARKPEPGQPLFPDSFLEA